MLLNFDPSNSYRFFAINKILMSHATRINFWTVYYIENALSMLLNNKFDA